MMLCQQTSVVKLLLLCLFAFSKQCIAKREKRFADEQSNSPRKTTTTIRHQTIITEPSPENAMPTELPPRPNTRTVPKDQGSSFAPELETTAPDATETVQKKEVRVTVTAPATKTAMGHSETVKKGPESKKTAIKDGEPVVEEEGGPEAVPCPEPLRVTPLFSVKILDADDQRVLSAPHFLMTPIGPRHSMDTASAIEGQSKEATAKDPHKALDDLFRTAWNSEMRKSNDESKAEGDEKGTANGKEQPKTKGPEREDSGKEEGVGHEAGAKEEGISKDTEEPAPQNEDPQDAEPDANAKPDADTEPDTAADPDTASESAVFGLHPVMFLATVMFTVASVLFSFFMLHR